MQFSALLVKFCIFLSFCFQQKSSFQHFCNSGPVVVNPLSFIWERLHLSFVVKGLCFWINYPWSMVQRSATGSVLRLRSTSFDHHPAPVPASPHLFLFFFVCTGHGGFFLSLLVVRQHPFHLLGLLAVKVSQGLMLGFPK